MIHLTKEQAEILINNLNEVYYRISDFIALCPEEKKSFSVIVDWDSSKEVYEYFKELNSITEYLINECKKIEDTTA